jgi:type VI secretion system protein ImpG
MLNKYYQDELAYLREMGQEFARANPQGAHFVGEASSDPDVERLLEGFAFLTARLRQKLENELPELTHSLLELLWPHYLRPIPSTTIIQFEALPQAAKEIRTIPRGAELHSIPVDGTPCRFRTVSDVTLAPLILETLTLRKDATPQLKLRFRLPDGVSLKKVQIPGLRFHLAGDPAASRALYLCLCRYVKRITVQAAGSTTVLPMGAAAVKPVGFSAGEALLPFPGNSFLGFRLLQEYFAFPSKFMFVDLTGLQGLSALGDAAAFDLTFELSRLPEGMPPITAANLLLNCTPAINLFAHDADPIRVDHTRAEYRVRPSGQNPEHFEVYAIDRVGALQRGTGKAVEYRPLFRFQRSAGPDVRFYRHFLAPSAMNEGWEVFLIPVPAQTPGELPDVEVLSLELTCTNRQLPSKLNVGDVATATSTSPAFARFKNITRPTPSVPPPLGGDLHWRLLSHLSLNYVSFADLETLRAVLGLYHFRARVDRQAEHGLRQLLDGIKRLSASPCTRLEQGAPIRGLAIELEVDEENFAGEGEAYLFGSILNEFFSQYASLNAFSRLTLKGLKFGEIHTWPIRLGDRIIL